MAMGLQRTHAMLLSRLSLVFFASSCGVASATALVPLPSPKLSLPVGGLEVNRGQAKPEILFLGRGGPNVAVAAQSVLYSPLGVRLSLVASNPAPVVGFADPLPGVVNSFTGADAQKWVTGIPRYASAHLAEVYPGIDAQYVMEADGRFTLRMLFRPGADPTAAVFEITKAVSIVRTPDGSLVARLGITRFDPALGFEAPLAVQETGSGPVGRSVSFEVQSTTRFGFQVEAHDSTLPLRIEMRLGAAALSFANPRHFVDAAGNTFIAATIPDAAGKDAPLPADRWEGCGTSISLPIPCWDVVVYKFSKAGELVFASYLSGKTREAASFLRFGPDGALIVTGTTDSADFPVTAAALQRVYGGPPATIGSSFDAEFFSGDFFAARVDPATGALRAATFLGGPNADRVGETAMGADGSVYVLPKWLGQFSARMPVTHEALQADCTEDPCANGYAARVSPSLDRLLYGTYLPGRVQATAKLHSDGSVYYAGAAGPGFPVTPAAYQRQAAGKEDGIVARLDPSGSSLMFATYVGTAETDWILRIAVAPDGSVWAGVSSFVQCCINIQYRLLRLDAKGERRLAEKPIDVGDLAVDREGNLLATAAGKFTVGPDAFLANACAWSYLAYIKLSPSGEQLFATYLPAGSGSDFDGTSDRGLPILLIGNERFEVVEGQSMGVFAGCVVDATSFGNPDTLSPGAIVTLFGSRMGPREGIRFQFEDGRVPTVLGGARVLVNGEPAPILYASYWQVNVILPYSLPVRTRPKIQVESNGNAGNELGGFFVQRAGISLFRLDDSPSRPAAALNEDGTVNSPRSPAKKGSRVVLFGTGGGPTVPPSVAGEMTPLEPRPLEFGAIVEIAGGPSLTVEYAGAAPGLVSGVTQINIKLPDQIPEIQGFPRGIVPLRVVTPGLTYYPGIVTVAVSPD